MAIVGQIYGRLTALKIVGKTVSGNCRVLCRCACGKEKVLQWRAAKSCGCLRSEAQKRRLSPGKSSVRSLWLNYRAGAKRRQHVFDLTLDQFEILINKNCVYCGRPPSSVIRAPRRNGILIYNGIDRIDNKKGYIVGNVATACAKCGMAKQKMTVQEFKTWISEVYKYLCT